jgi:2-aminoadipate transaminase
MRAIDLLPIAVEHDVAFVPGMPFYADNGDPRALRLSFVTPSLDEIYRGVAALAKAIDQYRKYYTHKRKTYAENLGTY